MPAGSGRRPGTRPLGEIALKLSPYLPAYFHKNQNGTHCPLRSLFVRVATLKQVALDAKAHDDLDRSGTVAGNHGLAGQCTKPAAWRRPNPPCTQKRNLDRHAGRMLRGDRLLRLRPGLDHFMRSPLLSVHSLLAVAVMLFAVTSVVVRGKPLVLALWRL